MGWSTYKLVKSNARVFKSRAAAVGSSISNKFFNLTFGGADGSLTEINGVPFRMDYAWYNEVSMDYFSFLRVCFIKKTVGWKQRQLYATEWSIHFSSQFDNSVSNQSFVVAVANCSRTGLSSCVFEVSDPKRFYFPFLKRLLRKIQRLGSGCRATVCKPKLY